MKTKIIQEKELQNLRYDISLFLEENKFKSSFGWTCEKCAGWGCGTHGSGGFCENTKKINSFSDIKQMIGEEKALELKNKIITFFEK